MLMGMIYDATTKTGARVLMCKPVRPSGVQQSRSSIGSNGWRGCFVTPRQVAALPRHPHPKTRQGGSATGRLTSQLPDLNQADVGDSLRHVEVKEAFINELAADASVPDGEIFEFHQPLQVDAHLRQAPAASVAEFFAGEGSRAFDSALVAVRKDFADVGEQAACLRR